MNFEKMTANISNFEKITVNILRFQNLEKKSIYKYSHIPTLFSHHFLLSNIYFILLKFIMNHSNFNFYDAFDFDDDILMFAFQVATAVVAEKESNNQGRRTEYHGSILSNNIVNHNRKECELRLYNDYFAKFTESQF